MCKIAQIAHRGSSVPTRTITTGVAASGRCPVTGAVVSSALVSPWASRQKARAALRSTAVPPSALLRPCMASVLRAVPG